MARFRHRVRILSISEFQRRFGSPESCTQWLSASRWPEGFRCPACGHRHAVFIATRLLHPCSACRRQTSLTAGTLFHKSRVPLHKWFWAIDRLAQDKKGCSALLLSQELDVCYPTAWLMAHKIRQVMADGSTRRLLQNIVERDDAFLGGERPGRRGRGARGKTPLLVAVEARAEGRPGQAALQPIRNLRPARAAAFANARLAPGCHIRSDASSIFARLAEQGYRHESEKVGYDRNRAVRRFPLVHRVISNLKRFLLGRHHATAAKHAGRYVGEFVYRFNHRWQEADRFQRLLKRCIAQWPVTSPQLVAAELR
jgi:hypothetical protein